jgi:hypothetical protein
MVASFPMLPEWKLPAVDVHAVFAAGRLAKTCSTAFCRFPGRIPKAFAAIAALSTR